MNYAPRRRHLFEFNDLRATPRPLRDAIVEALSRTLAWGGILEGLVEPFGEFMDRTGACEVLDLGAGGGSPAVLLARALRQAGRLSPRFLLTDLYPRQEQWSTLREECLEHIDFIEYSVDATQIDSELSVGRARMVINVLHHLPPEIARGVIADAIAQRSPLFIAEAFVGRNPLQFANFAPFGIPALYATPLLTRRDRLAKAALIWGSPIALLAGVWDGLVSTQRIYSEEELRAMIASSPGYEAAHITYGIFRYPPRGRGYFLAISF